MSYLNNSKFLNRGLVKVTLLLSVVTVFALAAGTLFVSAPATNAAATFDPPISIDHYYSDGDEVFPEFDCQLNPLFNDVTIEGSGGMIDAPGSGSGQYGIQIDWGDGTIENSHDHSSKITFTPSDPGKTFTYTYSGDHTYAGNATLDLEVIIYHSNPNGNDGTIGSIIEVQVCPNPYEPAELTIIKEVINDDLTGTSIASDFDYGLSDQTDTFIYEAVASPGRIHELASGTFTVSEDPYTGYTTDISCVCENEACTLDSNDTVTLDANETASGVATCTITNDDIPEGPLPGTIIVEKQTLPDGDEADFEFSGDASGTISDGETIVVSDVAPGQYTSEETVPEGWILTDIACDDDDSTGDTETGIANFVVAEEETVTCVFTNTKLGTITVEKTLINDSGTGTATTTDFSFFIDGEPVDRDSAYSYEPGTYTVSETGPQGYATSFSGACDDTDQVVLGAGEELTCTITNDDYPYEDPGTGTILGSKFLDYDGNGIWDEEEGLIDWTIQLFKDGFGLFATTTTASDGSFSFTNLFGGLYTLSEILQAGWIQTAGDVEYAVELDPEGTETEIIFGNFELFSISGKKYNDTDQDGVRTNGEIDPNLPEWTIQLDLVGTSTPPTCESGTVEAASVNGEFCEVATNSSGNYEFINLGPGDYIVLEVLEEGWIQTAPTSATGLGGLDNGTYEVAGRSGVNRANRNFGNYESPVVPICELNGLFG
ncbi:collagen binding domain-containing protein, partial [Patescibacteria group bacterium]